MPWHGDFMHEGVSMKKKYYNKNSESVAEKFLVQVTDPLQYDKLHTLSAEYSVSVDYLVNIAIERLISDVDFIRNLRIRKQ